MNDNTNSRLLLEWLLCSLFIGLGMGRGLAAGNNLFWDSRFFLPGIQGEVRAITVHGNDLYAGGVFASADDLAVSNIAKWNGAQWSALGGGLNGSVNAIALRGSEVFVGGTFTAAGGASAKQIAKWNGTNWSALGAGIQGTRVTALAVDAAGALYVGGEFTNAGPIAVANIAKWNGTTWSALGTGLSNDPYAAWVLALAARGSEVFAGGFFTDAGGVSVSCIARWNGTSWATLGTGVDDVNYLPQVAALAVKGTDVYVGGGFTTAGNVSAAHAARWNGASWSALGGGLTRPFGDIPVTSLAVSGENLVVGGRFELAGAPSGTNLARWNGSAWSTIGGGAIGSIKAVADGGTHIYAGGAFSVSNALTSLALAGWNGAAWSNPSGGGGQGVAGPVTALALVGNHAYAGGDFRSAGGVRALNVARWDGAAWSALGAGVGGPVYALGPASNALYVAGQFASAGGQPANNIAMWNGADFSSLGSGVNGTIRALALPAGPAGGLYVAGGFTSAGGITASNIARWNGSQWSGLALGLNGPVYALVAKGSILYAGGRFTSAGGVNATNIACWNGQTWSPLSTGVSGVANPIMRTRPPPVSSLAVVGEDLYVGGDFAIAGGVRATNIARWDGTNWRAVGTGVPGVPALAPPPAVAAMAVHRGALYIGGAFPVAGGTGANNIAKWDGTNWAPLGSGVTVGVSGPPSVAALAVNPTGLFIGGQFKFVGGKPASDFCIGQFGPTLRIARAGAAVQISWPAGPGSVLESRETLSSGLWREVTNAPTPVGGQLLLSVPAVGGSRFYRVAERP